MGEIVPRWEWRTFGRTFGDADARLAALEPERVQESDEVYLLAPVSDANVKVRDGLMDVKHLEKVGEAGLERWRPVMKSRFPLASAEAGVVFAELGVTPPSPGPPAYPLERLEAELSAPSRGVRVLPVHKRRLRYTIEGCAAELTEVTAAGGSIRTVAIESEDAARVLAALGAMGLAGRENVSYPRGLKRFLAARS